VAAATITAEVRVATAQAIEPDTSRIAARWLLAKAPLLKDSMTVVEETEYMEEVLAFFSAIAARDSAVRIRSGRDAVRALEDLLAPDSVNVLLQSDPPGFPVRFHRISDGPETVQQVTTDSLLKLPAGLYRFGFFNNATGEIRQQGRVCLDDCRIRWRF
jgi:hypothetical protein